jgi:hypothetical protein
MDEFLSLMDNSIKPLITKYSGSISDLDYKPENDSKDKNTQINPRIDLLLQKIISSVLKTNEFKDEDDLKRYEEDCHLLVSAFRMSQNLLLWYSLASKINALYKNATQEDRDFNVLCDLYILQLQYREIQKPSDLISEFSHIKRFYLRLYENHNEPIIRDYINSVLAKINEIQYCSDGNELAIKMADLAVLYKNSKLNPEDVIFTHSMRFLESFTHNVCRQHLSFIKTELMSQKNNLQDSLFALRENIETLQIRFSADSTIVSAFSEFCAVLENDKNTTEKTKAILARHFEIVVAEFLSGKMKTLKEIHQCGDNLKLELLGKPIVYPVQNTTTGVISGAADLFSRGVSALPKLSFVGVASSAVKLFFDHDQSTRYENEIKEVKLALEHLEKVMRDFCALDSNKSALSIKRK